MDREVLRVALPFTSFTAELPPEWGDMTEDQRQDYLNDVYMDNGFMPSFQYARVTVSAEPKP